MIHKPLTEINQTDLEGLVSDQIAESKVLDYKLQLNDLRQSGVKKEFLADICSFANCAGGDLIIGIEDSDGIAAKVIGVSIEEQDTLRAQIEQILQSGIFPRISGIEIRFLPLANESYIIYIRIPRSWSAPHMVSFEQSSRFYSRNSAGKYQLDHEEIRSAFYAAQGPQDKMRQFRQNRVATVTDTYFEALKSNHIGLLIHILPISAFSTIQQLDLRLVSSNWNAIKPMGANGYNSRHNFDGYFTYTPHHGLALPQNYLQIYRNGCLEYFDNLDTEKVPLGHIEGQISRSLGDTQELLRGLQMSNSFFFCLTLLSVANKAAYIGQGSPTYKNISYSIEIPEIGMETIEAYTMETLKPAFDILANAFGLEQSLGYNSNGSYKF